MDLFFTGMVKIGQPAFSVRSPFNATFFVVKFLILFCPGCYGFTANLLILKVVI
jgi:hypothetical protein